MQNEVISLLKELSYAFDAFGISSLQVSPLYPSVEFSMQLPKDLAELCIDSGIYDLELEDDEYVLIYKGR